MGFEWWILVCGLAVIALGILVWAGFPRRVAVWVGNRIADLGGSSVPGGKK